MQQSVRPLSPLLRKTRNAPKLIAAGALFTCATGVFAHEGHAVSTLHWHATDTFGLVVIAVLAAVAVAVAVAVAASRGGK
jgi:hypothetical protein